MVDPCGRIYRTDCETVAWRMKTALCPEAAGRAASAAIILCFHRK